MTTSDGNGLKYIGECLYRNHNDVYYALVKVAGKQIKRSLKTKDLSLAKRRLADFRKKAERLTGEETTMTFDALVERWLKLIKPQQKASSYERRVTCLRQVLPYFQGILVRSVGNREVEAWRIARNVKLAPRSFNIEAETLRLLFEYAKEELRIILENPISNVKRRKGSRKQLVIPTKEQFRLLMTTMREEVNTKDAVNFVEFLAYSGLRVNEGNKVLWQDIDFKMNTLTVTGGEIGTKNHEVRVIPLFPPLQKLLTRFKSDLKGKPDPANRVFAIDSAKKAIAGACKRAKLPHWGHHAMRHFFCSNCIEAGIDFKTIAEWLGHKDGGVLVAKTYGHLRAEHSHAMAQKVTFEVEHEEATTEKE